jgi:predicted acylesterase/phospholipase RssA
MFGTRYFATRPRPQTRRDAAVDEEWVVVRSPVELRRAVEASSRVPLLYGNPILDGANVLIDGVFTNNAPVELALEYGARHVFVVTSSKKGYVFDRPVQTLVRRQLRRLFHGFERASRQLGFLPRQVHLSRELGDLARLSAIVPEPKPLDLDALRRRYPDQEIHVIHPTENIPVNRFFESRPAVLGRLYDLGRELADGLPNIET